MAFEAYRLNELLSQEEKTFAQRTHAFEGNFWNTSLILNLLLARQLQDLKPGQLASMFERAVIAMEKSAAAQERTAAALEKIASPQTHAFSLPPSPKQGQTS